MINFNNLSPQNEGSRWREQLNQFVKQNEQKLAALVWGLSLERKEGENETVLGIDLLPNPHFVSCSRAALERLNENVGHQLQEVLGIIDNHKPEQEVVMICIGEGQLKLINFEPNPSPGECYEQMSEDIDTLLSQLEQQLQEQISTL